MEICLNALLFHQISAMEIRSSAYLLLISFKLAICGLV